MFISDFYSDGISAKLSRRVNAENVPNINDQMFKGCNNLPQSLLNQLNADNPEVDFEEVTCPVELDVKSNCSLTNINQPNKKKMDGVNLFEALTNNKDKKSSIKYQNEWTALMFAIRYNKNTCISKLLIGFRVNTDITDANITDKENSNLLIINKAINLCPDQISINKIRMDNPNINQQSKDG
ncbi:hypothetical protein H8356DRAFT_1334984 [Neocallimastix lanati (nom. inval.)]|nr:hypothetical protein H8356DRAFT_1334984 [Neocallimastix sp. JGI-2020a]